MPVRPVHLHVEQKDDNVIVQVQVQKLGIDELPSFGARIDDITAWCAHKTVILDLSQVSMLSSVVISRIFKARQEILEAGGKLRIVCATPTVEKVLRTVQLDRIVGLFHSVDEAVSKKE